MSPRRDEPEFVSYYGRPILKEPTWKAPDIAGYLFLGGLAGASSILGAASSETGRPVLARGSKVAAVAAITASAAALVHDLGRPSRFLNMLRVAKPTSPMSAGSWLLTGYAPLAAATALSDLTGVLPRVGRAAGVGAAILGAGVSSYTAVLIGDTAVPTWHEGRRALPYVFVGSAAAAAGGLGVICAPSDEAGPARRVAVVGAAAELAATELLHRQAGLAGETLKTGRAGGVMRAAGALTAVGAVLSVLGRRSRTVTAVAGTTLLAGSACTRFGIFEAGRESTRDPKYTVLPQRARRDEETQDVPARKR